MLPTDLSCNPRLSIYTATNAVVPGPERPLGASHAIKLGDDTEIKMCPLEDPFPIPRPHEVGLEAAMKATLEYSRAQRERVMGRAMGHQ